MANKSGNMPRSCLVDGCAREHAARGLCDTHWAAAKRQGRLAEFGIERIPSPAICTVDDCGRRPLARGLCGKHYQRVYLNGSVALKGTARGEAAAFLMGHVNYQGDDCLIWPYSRNRDGYATVGRGGRNMKASREMCALAHGDPPFIGAQAAHSCGRGHDGCVNPKHIRWATVQSNSDDKILHGTQARGEMHGKAKLTAAQVQEARARYERGGIGLKQLGAHYGLSYSGMRSAVRGVNWKTVG
jgi:hypothetical protein